jgi:hypothetical protein
MDILRYHPGGCGKNVELSKGYYKYNYKCMHRYADRHTDCFCKVVP